MQVGAVCSTVRPPQERVDLATLLASLAISESAQPFSLLQVLHHRCQRHLPHCSKGHWPNRRCFAIATTAASSPKNRTSANANPTADSTERLAVHSKCPERAEVAAAPKVELESALAVATAHSAKPDSQRPTEESVQV
jgi:hypothetical protein